MHVFLLVYVLSVRECLCVCVCVSEVCVPVYVYYMMCYRYPVHAGAAPFFFSCGASLSPTSSPLLPPHTVLPFFGLTCTIVIVSCLMHNIFLLLPNFFLLSIRVCVCVCVCE